VLFPFQQKDQQMMSRNGHSWWVISIVLFLVAMIHIVHGQNMGCASDKDCLSNYRCESISKPNLKEKYNVCVPKSLSKNVVDSLNDKALNIIELRSKPLSAIVLENKESTSEATTASNSLEASTKLSVDSASTMSGKPSVDRTSGIHGDVGIGSQNSVTEDEEEETEKEENEEEENDEEEEEEEKDEDNEDEDEDEKDDEEDEDEEE